MIVSFLARNLYLLLGSINPANLNLNLLTRPKCFSFCAPFSIAFLCTSCSSLANLLPIFNQFENFDFSCFECCRWCLFCFDNNANYDLDVDKLIFMRQTKMLNELLCPPSLCLCTIVYEMKWNFPLVQKDFIGWLNLVFILQVTARRFEQPDSPAARI